MRWLAAHTWLIVLVPLVLVIGLSGYTGKPLNLLKDTEVGYLDQDTILAMRLLSEGQERAKTMRYEAEVENGGRVLLYLQKDSLPMPRMGDVLLVQTIVRRGGRMGEFDYGLYLRRQGIVGSCWAYRRNWQVIDHEEIKGLRVMAYRCQRNLHERYKEMGIRGKELGVLSALTLGYREELDKNVQRSFSASGAMHILAVSGLHTGIVWGIVMWVLTLGGWRKPLWEERWKRLILTLSAIVLIWVYAFITGLSPSVMRSALMLSFWSLSSLLDRYTSRWNPVFAAAVIILIINPLSLWSVSFQLSFAAVVGIMLVGSWLQRKVVLRGRIVSYIGGLLIVSIAAQVGTMPLTMYYFGQTSNYFALTNVLVIPMAFVLLLLGFITLAMSWCMLGEWLAIVTRWCTWLLRASVERVESLPGSTTKISLSEWGLIGMYGVIVCGIMMLRKEKVNWWWFIGAVICLLVILKFEVYANI